MAIGSIAARKVLSGLFALPLVVVACGGGQPQTGAAPTAPPGGMMPLPDWAKAMKVTIQSPSPGAKVTANQVPLKVSFSGFQSTCDLAGTKDVKGFGHYHVLIDKSLVDMYCAPDTTVSMQNLKPGNHEIAVVPALNDHAEVEDNASTVTVDYEPGQAPPAIAPATFGGPPSIKIISPAAGSTVSGPFDVAVQVSNFNVTCDLEGKPDVSGYGHWHVNADTTSGPMMGMMTMLRMSCGNVMHLSARGMTPGKHTLIAFLADNQHAPLNPMVQDQVVVNVSR